MNSIEITLTEKQINQLKDEIELNSNIVSDIQEQVFCQPIIDDKGIQLRPVLFDAGGEFVDEGRDMSLSEMILELCSHYSAIKKPLDIDIKEKMIKELKEAIYTVENWIGK